MTVGKKSGQAGNAVPLQGESEIRQESSAADVLTITLASGVDSTAGGQGLVVRRFGTEGASGGVEPFAVEYDGVRGRRHIVAMPVSATTYSVSASQSGALIVIPACASAMIVTLPAAEAGLWYEFYGAGTMASGVSFKGQSTGLIVAFNNAAADSILMGTSAVGGIGGSIRFVSDGSLWYSIMQPAFSSAAPTTATMTYWTIVDT